MSSRKRSRTVRPAAGAGAGDDPFDAVLETWGFENWDEAAQWMSEASLQEIDAFFAALADALD